MVSILELLKAKIDDYVFCCMVFIPPSPTGDESTRAICCQSRICKTAVYRLPEKCLFFAPEK